MLTNNCLTFISVCQHLETLSLSGCNRITSTSPLHLCANIINIDLSLCYRLKDFDSLFLLEKLEYLNVSGTKLTDVQLSRFYKMKTLLQIDISKCYNIINHDRNKPVNLEIILDSFEAGEVEWDDSDSGDERT